MNKGNHQSTGSNCSPDAVVKKWASQNVMCKNNSCSNTENKQCMRKSMINEIRKSDRPAISANNRLLRAWNRRPFVFCSERAEMPCCCCCCSQVCAVCVMGAFLPLPAPGSLGGSGMNGAAIARYFGARFVIYDMFVWRMFHRSPVGVSTMTGPGRKRRGHRDDKFAHCSCVVLRTNDILGCWVVVMHRRPAASCSLVCFRRDSHGQRSQRRWSQFLVAIGIALPCSRRPMTSKLH